tara:strand:+ start:149 stop:1072 length:924 start_codon:yes stop_codon:yes gene_type:complete
MKVAFFTEMGFTGKVPRNHPNMRTEFAWMCALEADHYNIHSDSIPDYYDIGVIIVPKNSPGFDINKLRSYCSKLGVMQEGPNWNWQDYKMEDQIWYYNTLIDADFILVHNKSDLNYYKGLVNKKKVFPMHSLMITDDVVSRNEWGDVVVIGGNMCSWYGGFDSYVIAQEFDMPIVVPSMGRKIEREEELENLQHLDYMNWRKWIDCLSQYHVGIHLMRTHAAGTFALNCAFHGIPCIGYTGLDTQEKCHSRLTVDIGDLNSAREKARLLKEDDYFYQTCSNEAREKYNAIYSEHEWLSRWNGIVELI